MNLQKLKEILDKGGATLSHLTLEPITMQGGYQVAVSDNSMVLCLDDMALESVLFVIRALSSDIQFKRDMAYIGLWVNKGKLYIEKSYYTSNLATAMEMAHKYKQLAVWDWANGKEIKL